jgi:hypothetical protein
MNTLWSGIHRAFVAVVEIARARGANASSAPCSWVCCLP